MNREGQNQDFGNHTGALPPDCDSRLPTGVWTLDDEIAALDGITWVAQLAQGVLQKNIKIATFGAGCVETLTQNWSTRIYAKSGIARLVSWVKFYLWAQFSALFLAV